MLEKITLYTHFDLLQISTPSFPSPSPPSFYSQHHCLHVWLILHKISQGYIGKHSCREGSSAQLENGFVHKCELSNHLRILFLLHLVIRTVPFGSNGYTSKHLPSNCKVKNHSLTMQVSFFKMKGEGLHANSVAISVAISVVILLLTPPHFRSRCIKAQT